MYAKQDVCQTVGHVVNAPYIQLITDKKNPICVVFLFIKKVFFEKALSTNCIPNAPLTCTYIKSTQISSCPFNKHYCQTSYSHLPTSLCMSIILIDHQWIMCTIVTCQLTQLLPWAHYNIKCPTPFIQGSVIRDV